MEQGWGARFDAYVDRIAVALGGHRRGDVMRDYLTGLVLPLQRKSMEPIAASITPDKDQVSAAHQRIHHFITSAPWSSEDLLHAVFQWAQPSFEKHPLETWIVDDTGMPKQGDHSVGVARQYCGQLGKTDNCQVAVSISVANEQGSLPVGYRLYLPETWASDKARRKKAGVPREVTFKTKPGIALDLMTAALANGVPPGVVLADAAYGDECAFRERLTAMELTYFVAIRKTTGVWHDGRLPEPPAQRAGRGRPRKRQRITASNRPVQAGTIAQEIAPSAWETVTWREGADAKPMTSRFCRLRVRPAHGDHLRSEVRNEEWLVMEWPDTEAAPSDYWLSTLPESIAFEDLVRIGKQRWRIERDYQELKQEFGLGHFEGRSWTGFHHHAALCVAAYAFLQANRGSISPSGHRSHRKGLKQACSRPPGYIPRGAHRPEARAPQEAFPGDHATRHRPRLGATPRTMPLLPASARSSALTQ